MFIYGLAWVLSCVILLTVMFAVLLRGHRELDVPLLLFLLIFLTMWTVGGWMTPASPIAIGFSWLMLLIVGLVATLMPSALIPAGRRPRYPATRDLQAREAEGKKTTVFNLLSVCLDVPHNACGGDCA
jgi:hypothetical protein